jgi:O-antigen/teichoic acid export membrane protein
MGIGVGLPRYIAIAIASSQREKISSYFYSTLFILSFVMTGVSVVFFLFEDQLAFLLFSNTSYRTFIFPLLIMLWGLVLHSLCYAFFRGEMRMKPANSLQLLNLGLVPVFIFMFGNDIVQVLLYTGIAWIIISFVFFLMIILRLKPETKHIRSSAFELLKYGLQRVPGDVVLGGFFALPTYFIAHLINDNLNSAGNLAFAMLLLNMTGAAFGPICLLLLPQASNAIANKDYSLLKKYSREILILTLIISGIGLIVVEIFAGPLVSLYMNGDYPDMVEVVRIMMPGAVGYAVYISLRSILDAYHVKAVNTRNIFLCFILFTALSFAVFFTGFHYYYILYSFMISISLLGVLTYTETNKIFNKPH